MRFQGRRNRIDAETMPGSTGKAANRKHGSNAVFRRKSSDISCLYERSTRAMTDRLTERVVYSGRVQGVGFRYTVRSMAGRYPLAGFVRNLPDGTVELTVQGGKGAIEALLGEVGTHFRHNIRDCVRGEVAGDEAFEGFEIRF